MNAGQPTVVIIGGGPIGLACALLLAARRIGSCVLDSRTVEQARTGPRLLAVSRGSWQVLTPVLPQPPPRAPIREVQVSSAGEFGATRIGADDFDGADLGATVYYGDLLASLAAAAAAQPLIEVRRPVQAIDVTQKPDRVTIALADGAQLSAGIVVHAEGRPQGGVPGEDHALLAELRLRQVGAMREPSTAVAYERFTREGPLALLPTPQPATQLAMSGEGVALSLVWCMGGAAAQLRAAMSDEDFRAELQEAIGARIGSVTSVGPRRGVILPQQLVESVHANRVVALGNAAQTLHPVAGQGFNLGVRDCATLADELAASDDAIAALARHARRRRIDRSAIAGITRWLPGIFATRFAPVAVARSAALTALDLLPPLRRELASVLMFGVRS